MRYAFTDCISSQFLHTPISSDNGECYSEFFHCVMNTLFDWLHVHIITKEGPTRLDHRVPSKYISKDTMVVVATINKHQVGCSFLLLHIRSTHGAGQWQGNNDVVCIVLDDVMQELIIHTWVTGMAVESVAKFVGISPGLCGSKPCVDTND